MFPASRAGRLGVPDYAPAVVGIFFEEIVPVPAHNVMEQVGYALNAGVSDS